MPDPGREILRTAVGREDGGGEELAVLSLEGDLDLSVIGEFEERVGELQLEGLPVRIDLTRLRFVDSSGIHALVRAHANLEGSGPGCRLRLTEGSSVEEVLRMSGVLEHLNVDRSPSGDGGS